MQNCDVIVTSGTVAFNESGRFDVHIPQRDFACNA